MALTENSIPDSDAARYEACVRACEGTPTERLTTGIVAVLFKGSDFAYCAWCGFTAPKAQPELIQQHMMGECKEHPLSQAANTLLLYRVAFQLYKDHVDGAPIPEPWTLPIITDILDVKPLPEEDRREFAALGYEMSLQIAAARAGTAETSEAAERGSDDASNA